MKKYKLVPPVLRENAQDCLRRMNEALACMIFHTQKEAAEWIAYRYSGSTSRSVQATYSLVVDDGQTPAQQICPCGDCVPLPPIQEYPAEAVPIQLRYAEPINRAAIDSEITATINAADDIPDHDLNHAILAARCGARNIGWMFTYYANAMEAKVRKWEREALQAKIEGCPNDEGCMGDCADHRKRLAELEAAGG